MLTGMQKVKAWRVAVGSKNTIGLEVTHVTFENNTYENKLCIHFSDVLTSKSN